jgi:hemerythrin superfamily protein
MEEANYAERRRSPHSGSRACEETVPAVRGGRTPGAPEKAGIVEEVLAELEVHTTLEEELFYPAVKQKTDQDGKDLVAEAVEEHHVVTTLMVELKDLDPTDERYEAKFKVVMETVTHHMEEEEGEMFLEAKAVLGKGLEHLGTQMQERKEHLTAGQQVWGRSRAQGQFSGTWPGGGKTLRAGVSQIHRHHVDHGREVFTRRYGVRVLPTLQPACACTWCLAGMDRTIHPVLVRRCCGRHGARWA